MRYITEEEAKQRLADGICTVAEDERLTPAAAELMRASNKKPAPQVAAHPISFQPASSIPVPGPEAKDAEPKAAPAQESCVVCKPCIGRTHLDADTQVHKSHPRIELRGRMDTLIAAAVVVETQFDAKKRLPDILKNGVAEVRNWLWHMLCAEVSGQPMPTTTLCGMTPEMLHAVSLDPAKFLGQAHILPDAGYGQSVALLNWLRAQVRELEVLLAKTGERDDLLDAANRLSTAVYVLMLLTVMAEQGREIRPLV